MSENTASQKNQGKKFEVITYEETVSFNYTLPGEDEQKTIETEIILIWEDTIEAFKEAHGDDKAYELHRFALERQKQYFVNQIDERTEQLIEEVEEEIANKMKYGFEFTGQLHNDD